MAYDEELARRVRELVADEPAVTEKRMFGGLAFLVNGHLSVAASRDGGLMVRVDPEDDEALRREPGVTPMIMRGRELAGWLRVAGEVLDDGALAAWVDRGIDWATSLPPR
jgi:TfoX/Sxy family transcriptional regulator of competence genes